MRAQAMKKYIFALTICFSSAHAAAQTPQQTGPQKETDKPTAPTQNVKREELNAVPDEVFNHELKDLDGRSFYLSNYRGQVFVINLWATWCGPCLLEIPRLVDLRKEYARRGVEFVGLTVESPAEDIRRVRDFARKYKMRYKVGWVDGDTARTLMNGRNSIPQTFVVAADGRVVMHFIGSNDIRPKILPEGIEKDLNPASEQPPRAPESPTPTPTARP